MKRGVFLNEKEFSIILSSGESLHTEFKSWKKAGSMRERIKLAVDELVAFANAKGGTVYFGVEDDGTVTGCEKYDTQSIIEAIYDKTRPSLFVDIEKIPYQGMMVLALKVEADGKTYGTTDGRFLKRLGKNSKPFFPDEMSHHFYREQIPDFSSKIVMESTLEDINLLEVYSLKEKLKIRDPKSTLPVLEDMAFLRDLGLIKEIDNVERLTVAGLLFVGKQNSISRLLPQAEVIYLHYSAENLEEYDLRLDLQQPIVNVLDRLTEKIQNDNKILNIQVGLFRLEVEDFSEKVFQEALLNALSHRDYESMGAVYVKHYPDKVVIENPGGFLDGITERNIITHPSAPRNKLIAETLQHLKYVQRTGQGVDIIFREMISMGKPYPEYQVFSDAVSLTLRSAVEDVSFVKFIVNEQEKNQIFLSLAELMIVRYLSENKRIKLSEAKDLTQISLENTRKALTNLVNMHLIESVGKEYMLTARVYEAVKNDLQYTRDKGVRYIKAKEMILEYLEHNESITNAAIQELCGFSKQQARTTIDKMRKEKLIILVGKGTRSCYQRIVYENK